MIDYCYDPVLNNTFKSKKNVKLQVYMHNVHSYIEGLMKYVKKAKMKPDQEKVK